MVELENEFLKKTGKLENGCKDLIKEILFCNSQLSIENIAIPYRDKIMQINEELSKKNIDFFSDEFPFLYQIEGDLFEDVSTATCILIKLLKITSLAYKLNCADKTLFFSNLLLSKYNNTCKKVRSYDFSNRIQYLMIQKYGSKELRQEDILTRLGSLEYDELVLEQMGLIHKVIPIEPKLLKLIKKA